MIASTFRIASTRRLASGLALVFLLVSCGTSGPSRPVDFVADSQLSKADWDHRERLIQTCVHRGGFEYVPVPFEVVRREFKYLEFPFSQIEVEKRRTLGYGAVDHIVRSRQASKANPNLAYGRKLSKAEVAKYGALIFPSPNAPHPKCSPKLTPRAPNFNRAILLVSKARNRFAQNPIALEISSRWSHCMKGKQFGAGKVWESATYAMEYVDHLLGSSEGPSDIARVREAELLLARADVDCLGSDVDTLNRQRLSIEAAVSK